MFNLMVWCLPTSFISANQREPGFDTFLFTLSKSRFSQRSNFFHHGARYQCRNCDKLKLWIKNFHQNCVIFNQIIFSPLQKILLKNFKDEIVRRVTYLLKCLSKLSNPLWTCRIALGMSKSSAVFGFHCWNQCFPTFKLRLHDFLILSLLFKYVKHIWRERCLSHDCILTRN